MIRNTKLIRHKGQSIVEYILMITAVIVFLLIFLARGGFWQTSYNSVISKQADDVLDSAQKIFK